MSALPQFSFYSQPSFAMPRRILPRIILSQGQPSAASTAMARRSSGFIPWRNLNRELLFDDVLKSIENKYVIENRSEVARFIQKNRLRGLLLEAIKPLSTFFGADTIKTLTLLRDDEESESLFCLLMTPGEMEDARRRLRLFDEDWWLVNSARSSGNLNFDFELI
jgi:hypothetical protein